MKSLTALYRRAHNLMRNLDGLQPQEAFEELLKFLFYKQLSEEAGFEGRQANEIRFKFAKYLNESNSWSTSLWRDHEFYLSDNCIEQLNNLFSEIRFCEIDFDVRSAALREFLTPEVRKGLGIYLTPDEVVKQIVKYVSPDPGSMCLDPACGSGTFLIELVKYWKSQNAQANEVWGADKNPRMLLIAELNLGHFPGIAFNRKHMDSLVQPLSDKESVWVKEGSFDHILTNPPFGVTVEVNQPAYSHYDLSYAVDGSTKSKVSSEWLFIERSMKWLKPGGYLAIVLPKSVLSNPSLKYERSVISEYGYLETVVQLPPETFLVTGAQTNTVVAFFRKYTKKIDKDASVRVSVATVSNVGYDSTGRYRDGSQLNELANELKSAKSGNCGCDYIVCHSGIRAAESIEVLSTSSVSARSSIAGIPLGDLASVVRTGKTPARSDYSDSGLFLVKVGNLTGAGINWVPRERNYVDTSNMTERKVRGFELIRSGDLLLTSSAHSPVYIAKKIDMVSEIPDWVGGKASFVGEVILVRPAEGSIPSTLLLAYLRHPSVVERIQTMVRGQTAHLHPQDLSSLRIPMSMFDNSEIWSNIEKQVKEEIVCSCKLNELAYKQGLIYKEIGNFFK